MVLWSHFWGPRSSRSCEVELIQEKVQLGGPREHDWTHLGCWARRVREGEFLVDAVSQGELDLAA